jgi:hypothetical protein
MINVIIVVVMFVGAITAEAIKDLTKFKAAQESDSKATFDMKLAITRWFRGAMSGMVSGGVLVEYVLPMLGGN